MEKEIGLFKVISFALAVNVLINGAILFVANQFFNVSFNF
jgi:hypothetical protein